MQEMTSLFMHVKDNQLFNPRTDLELWGPENVWVEIQVKSWKTLIGVIYRLPNSNAAYIVLINESIDKAGNTDISETFSFGGFNCDMF